MASDRMIARVREALHAARRDVVTFSGERAVSPAWVARRLGVTENTARVALVELMESGEAHRIPNPVDRRAHLYAIEEPA